MDKELEQEIENIISIVQLPDPYTEDGTITLWDLAPAGVGDEYGLTMSKAIQALITHKQDEARIEELEAIRDNFKSREPMPPPDALNFLFAHVDDRLKELQDKNRA